MYFKVMLTPNIQGCIYTPHYVIRIRPARQELGLQLCIQKPGYSPNVSYQVEIRLLNLYTNYLYGSSNSF